MKKSGAKKAKNQSAQERKLKFLKEVVHTDLDSVQGGTGCTGSCGTTLNSCIGQ